MRVHANVARILLLAAAALVAACGGGGGGNDAQAAAPGPAAAPAPAPAPASAITCGLEDFEAGILARVNQWRAAGASCGTQGQFAPAAALAWNTALTEAAAAHSNDMVFANFFSHTGSDGSTLTSRVDAAGYGWSRLGENIAVGQTTINQVVDGWMGSDGHCANIMNAAFRDIGVACVSGRASNTYRSYWTMDLGRPR